MIIVFQTVAVAFAMFSAVPVPQFSWNEKNMRFALCAFPLVGVVCGLCWMILLFLPLPVFLRGSLLCLAPLAVTGGIHLDGYADTCDAMASCGDAAGRQEILKDPHCGAFAVIRLCGYFIFYLALCVTLTPSVPAAVCAGLGFVLSRALSGWAVASRPLARETGLAHAFAAAADRRIVSRFLAGLAAAAAAAQIAAGGAAGLAMAAAAGLTLWRYIYVARVRFGGVSGDLAGWFLQKCELWQLAALVFCQLLEVGL